MRVDGQTIRIELSACYSVAGSSTVCRLVLTPDAATELREKLGTAIEDLE